MPAVAMLPRAEDRHEPFPAVKIDPRPVEHGVLNWNRAINAGLWGAAAMTALMLLFRGLDLSTLNLELFLGSMVTATLGFGPWALGLGIHLVIGAGFGVLYAALMETFEQSGFRAGILIGAVHAVVAGMILPLLGAAHPLVRAGSLPAPGPFATEMGDGSAAMLFVLLHLLYGAIVGSAYIVLSPAAEEKGPAPEPGRRPPTALRRG
jgi:hypothetical protein